MPPQPNADGVLLGWARPPREGTAYAVQLARDAGFTLVLADERSAQPSWLLRQPDRRSTAPSRRRHIASAETAKPGPALARLGPAIHTTPIHGRLSFLQRGSARY